MDPRYPIGEYEPKPFSESQKKAWLIDLAQLPNMLEAAILNLDEAQLHTPYRDGGWTCSRWYIMSPTVILMPFAA
jgi:hypothetical protein